MNILLTGSTGFIGSHVLTKLTQLDHKVTACVRNPKQQQVHFPQVNFVDIDFIQATTLDDWLPLLTGIDVVINTVGIISETKKQTFAALHTDAPSALFSAAEKVGVKRVIQISALGADDQAESQYHLSKLAADEVLASLSLDYVILKPSLVYGNGAKSMGLFRAMATLPIIPLIEGGTQKMQPIYVDDLVNTITNCIDENSSAQLTLNAVGPAEMSMEELLLKQRQWLGLKATKTISTPLKWILRFMPFTRWLDEPALTADSLKMLQRGNIADVSPLKKVLGEMPESMESILANNQASPADRWYAGLYFMRPLLRLGIAFIWIWTAIISTFFYPQAESFQLLERFGLSGAMLPIALYGSALMDFILGMAMFFYQPIRKVLWVQVGVIITYTALITAVLPEYWLHPFGEISKNIPMLIALFILIIMENRK